MNIKYMIRVNIASLDFESFVVHGYQKDAPMWSSTFLREAKAHKKFCEEHYGVNGAIYTICKVEEVE